MKSVTLLSLLLILCVVVEQSYAVECIPGQEKRNKCSYCNCTIAGWACKKLCVRKRAYDCEPGTSFKDKDGCNDCFCSKNGKAACTLKFCPKQG